jgi:hypothetical protein
VEAAISPRAICNVDLSVAFLIGWELIKADYWLRSAQQPTAGRVPLRSLQRGGACRLASRRAALRRFSRKSGADSRHSWR